MSADAITPTITEQSDLAALCQQLAGAPEIAFDTEFVSEDTFYPELCLVQVATRDSSAVVDAMSVEDITPLWEVITQGEHTTVFHAGREELNFMLRAVGELPHKLFDVQIAAGFCGNEYPASYGSIVGKFLGHKPLKGEQRTDWRKRPLTSAQVRYALEDVRYLLPLFDKFTAVLDERGRLGWLDEELENWQQEVAAAHKRKDWRRVSGIGKLGPRGLAIVREVWHWRLAEAERRNIPAKRVLRDDLIVEMAKRKTDQADQILNIRGMQKGTLTRKADELAECVRRGLEAEIESIPRSRQHAPSQLALLGQFLTPALTTICQRAEVAASMVGTATDVRELVAHRVGFSGSGKQDVPALARGWRAELVGNLINDLLDGKRSIRIVNAKNADPLSFDGVQ